MEGLWGVETDQGRVPLAQAEPFIFHNEERKNLDSMGMDIHKMVVMVFNREDASFWTMVPISWDETRYQWADVKRGELVNRVNEPNWEDWNSYGFIIDWDW